MRLRNLHQRARPFRYAGYGCLAVICLLLLDTERSLAQVLLGAGYCGVWPALLDRLWQRRTPVAMAATDPGIASTTARELRQHVAECALTGFAVGWTSLPPLAASAAALALLAGASAQAGWRLLAAAVPALAAGVGLGLWYAPVITTRSVLAADLLSVLLMLGYSLWLADRSFRQAQRLDRHRQALSERSAELERLAGRMQRYLSPSLRQRLMDAPEAAGGWERRWLTVAFVDLVGFTELADRTEPEVLIAVLDDYLEGLSELAERRGGELSTLLGDGALITFGLDERPDRQALVGSCLDFCSDVAPLLDALGRRWRARGELVQLRLRAGVASGYCTLGDRGGGERLEFTLIGGPVNLASRLQGQARPGGLLMDAASAALGEGRCGPVEMQRLTLKGLGEVVAFGFDPAAASAKVPAQPDRAPVEGG